MSTDKEQIHFIVEETFQSEDIDKRKELLEKLFLQIIKELENLKY